MPQKARLEFPLDRGDREAWDYYRDDRDRIKAWQKSTDSSLNGRENGRGQRYRYDAEGQLVEVWYEAPNPVATGDGAWGWEGFNIDAMGNLQQLNHLLRWGWTGFARRDNGLNQYLNWSGTPINHDGNGGVIHDGWISASYNALNQPVSISSPHSGGTMWFGYDPLGRCVKRWIGPSGAATSNPATYLYYEGWNLIQEGPSATSTTMLYVHGARVDEIVKQIRPTDGWERYFQHDARGHCILQTDNSGNVVEQYVYTAFGQPFFYDAAGTDLGHSPWGNRFLFTGREWLKDLWIYDYRHRLYHPELGRFLQPDPIHFKAGDYNLYRYCHNDPVNRSDPDGLAPGDPFGSPQDAARDVHSFINPTSIRQNAEYGSVIYRVGDRFFATPTFTDGAQTRVTLGTEADKSRIPAEVRSQATRVGDYHSHGDYSKNLINPKDGTSKVVRASKSENPESDHPSPGDKQRAGIIHQKVPNYRLFLGTPSKELKEYDAKKEKKL